MTLQVEKLSDQLATTIRLPYDSTLRTEIGNEGVMDQMTGLRTTVSCLYWDFDMGEWSNKGIQRLHFTVISKSMQSLCSLHLFDEYRRGALRSELTSLSGGRPQWILG
jgi:hypothetical protein